MQVNLMDFWPRILEATNQTLLMVGISLLAATLIGLPLGIALVVTKDGGLLENKPIFNALSSVVNFFRSIPFIILLVAILPVTRFIVGSSIGTAAAVVPLVIFSAPYIARLVESSLLEVKSGVIEAAEAMGATPWQIIARVYIPEALSSIVLNLTIATIGLVGASAMAGFVGGGGLGDLAISYGYQRFETDIMIATVLLLVVIVQITQTIGNFVSKKIRRQ
ncbi:MULTISPECIES: methionine ABC transporter permease [Halobacillus]|uniref:ABC-type transport system permease protein (Probable substrate methionine) n=1 Tax=Halobacillus halophilus (strain ATCC 35676 / DSM 2266 / JCM 20832 / KCTC 3685 / LMG 17431 / NBRC 102448 / NCIMB 2269) TaxID=866895 RepID=I0JT06_HALH3|nr:methionine ABC transporter permease [Halobacillus halophilus]ASF41199.1 methionine ABC transporter permease [Halobacillus halophilus]CCG47278.1 ABC-type transport system permease protein (probable substrate methionine) [Halobacillus halophilus DSM 2266]